MAYSLRLNPALDALARDRATALGVSLNALFSIAVDAYLRPAQQPGPAIAGAAPGTAAPAPAPVPTAQTGEPGDPGQAVQPGESDSGQPQGFTRPAGQTSFQRPHGKGKKRR